MGRTVLIAGDMAGGLADAKAKIGPLRHAVLGTPGWARTHPLTPTSRGLRRPP